MLGWSRDHDCSQTTAGFQSWSFRYQYAPFVGVPVAFSTQGSRPGHRPCFLLQDVPRSSHVTVDIQSTLVTPERIAVSRRIATATVGALATRLSFRRFHDTDANITERQFYPF